MKRIITCTDGTWNKPGETDDGHITQTNVQKIFQLIHKTDAANNIVQVKFYDEGVGSEGSKLIQIIDGATGDGLDTKILDAYKFIVWNFEPGDELYLFGFSRGAYTARSLAGLIRCCGIVKGYDLTLINKAFSIYRNRDNNTADSDAALDFAANNSFTSRIKFIGVWDTVGALGIPSELFAGFDATKYQFHDITLSSTVDNAYHALAIDEHRPQFKPSVWNESPNVKLNNINQNLEQVWFTGAHSDVGGGYPETGLSDIALEWMIEKASNTGLSIQKPDNLKPDYSGTLHNSKTAMYFLDKEYFRPIILGDETLKASLNPSVTQRMNDKNCNYKPENEFTGFNS
jgi:uncharacterized protein (DUF2235 family)